MTLSCYGSFPTIESFSVYLLVVTHLVYVDKQSAMVLELAFNGSITTCSLYVGEYKSMQQHRSHKQIA